jgi:hypothetical protein
VYATFHPTPPTPAEEEEEEDTEEDEITTLIPARTICTL